MRLASLGWGVGGLYICSGLRPFGLCALPPRLSKPAWECLLASSMACATGVFRVGLFACRKISPPSSELVLLPETVWW